MFALSDAPFIFRLEFLILSIILFCQRVGLGSFYNLIADNDEVFNYWEPIHFLSSLPFSRTSYVSTPIQSNQGQSVSNDEGQRDEQDRLAHKLYTGIIGRYLKTGIFRSKVVPSPVPSHEPLEKGGLLSTISDDDGQNNQRSNQDRNGNVNSSYLSPLSVPPSSMQTWEYSPAYSLRSYSYILCHCLLVWMSQLLNRLFGLSFGNLQSSLVPESVQIFFVTRGFLALIAALSELNFARSIKSVFGNRVATLYLLVNLFSPGAFSASNQIVPSATFMLISLWSFSYFFQNRVSMSLCLAVIGTIFCWPFAVIIYIPLALVALVKCGILRAIGTVLSSLVVILVIIAGVDYFYYGKFVIAPLNIVLYNIVMNKATLYGIESWSFYFKTLFLNFHLILILSVMGLMIMAINMFRRQRSITRYISSSTTSAAGIRESMFVALTPLPLWVGLMSLQPHKEERFLFVVYPLMCLSSAVALCWLISKSRRNVGVIDYEGLDGNLESGLRKKQDDWEKPEAQGTKRTWTENAPVPNFNYTTQAASSEAPPYKTGSFNILSFPPYRRHPELLTLSPAAKVTSSKFTSSKFTKVAPRESKVFNFLARFLWLSFWLLCFCLCASRLLAQYHYYWKPIVSVWATAAGLQFTNTWANSSESSTAFVPMTICSGREWHLFPSSFFLPPGSRLGFIKTDFTGLLPRVFEDTRSVPEHLNDDNRSEPALNTPLSACDFLVDSSDGHMNYMPRPNVLQFNDASLMYSPQAVDNAVEIFALNIKRRIKVVGCHRLLDRSRSRFPFRSFFAGDRLAAKAITYTQFCLWKIVPYK